MHHVPYFLYVCVYIYINENYFVLQNPHGILPEMVTEYKDH